MIGDFSPKIVHKGMPRGDADATMLDCKIDNLIQMWSEAGEERLKEKGQ
jgi:hypothetical protein